MKFFRLSYLLALKTSNTLQTRLHQSQRQRGASALEYIVLVGAIAVVLATAVTFFGDNVTDFFDGLADSIFGTGSTS